MRHITKHLTPATRDAVAKALEELNVPQAEARALARELIRVAVVAGESIDEQLIPWIRKHPKFPREEQAL